MLITREISYFLRLRSECYFKNKWNFSDDMCVYQWNAYSLDCKITRHHFFVWKIKIFTEASFGELSINQIFFKSEICYFIIYFSVKNPKPPVNITLSHLGNVILVTWSSPPGNHLPITSYKLCYRPLPKYSKICIIVLANRGNRFIINTQGHKGQLFLVTMTARIGDVESKFSMNKYLRACK